MYLHSRSNLSSCFRRHLRQVLHLCRSKARTVPSREALTMTKPLEVKVTLVMLLVCSVKVTKQRPLLVFHTLTWEEG